MTFPDFYPAKCPPEDARRDTVEVYRLVNHDPPEAVDFLPTVIEAPTRQMQQGHECIACATSVFTSEDAIEGKKQRFRALRNKLIAKGTIQPTDGKVLETLSKHHISWWVESNAPHASFGVN